MDKITVDGVEFVRQRSAGNRYVVVVDRGWIFAGDVRRENGRIFLSRVVHIMRWESIGFDGMIANPQSGKVVLRKLETTVEIPAGAEICSISVAEDWGIK